MNKRIKGALDQAGLRGNPTLRLIDDPPDVARSKCAAASGGYLPVSRIKVLSPVNPEGWRCDQEPLASRL
jgi:hypothetical protein